MKIKNLLSIFLMFCCFNILPSQTESTSNDMENHEFTLSKTQSNIDPFLSEELIDAICNGNIDRIKRFIEIEKGDINLKSEKFGQTLLMYSIENNKLDVLQYLIQNNADINLKDSLGRTALYIAVSFKLFEFIKILCNAGADINLKCSNDDKTPYDIAVEMSQSFFKYHTNCKPNSICFEDYVIIEIASYLHCIINTGKTPEKMYATDMLDKAYRERTLPFPREVLNIIKGYL